MTNRTTADPHTCYDDARAAAHFAAKAWDAAYLAILTKGPADWDASEAWVQACIAADSAGAAGRACKDLLDDVARNHKDAALKAKDAARTAAAKTGAVIP